MIPPHGPMRCTLTSKATIQSRFGMTTESLISMEGMRGRFCMKTTQFLAVNSSLISLKPIYLAGGSQLVYWGSGRMAKHLERHGRPCASLSLSLRKRSGCMGKDIDVCIGSRGPSRIPQGRVVLRAHCRRFELPQSFPSVSRHF